MSEDSLRAVLRPGEPFQEILWHRLADTDVAILLDSPGFLDSRWTEEELARAKMSNIRRKLRKNRGSFFT